MKTYSNIQSTLEGKHPNEQGWGTDASVNIDRMLEIKQMKNNNKCKSPFTEDITNKKEGII